MLREGERERDLEREKEIEAVRLREGERERGSEEEKHGKRGWEFSNKIKRGREMIRAERERKFCLHHFSSLCVIFIIALIQLSSFLYTSLYPYLDTTGIRILQYTSIHIHGHLYLH